MKKFFKLIDWKKFLKYELYCILIVGALYFASVMRGDNVFPENVFVVLIIPGLFGFMMILKTHIVLLEKKMGMKKK